MVEKIILRIVLLLAMLNARMLQWVIARRRRRSALA